MSQKQSKKVRKLFRNQYGEMAKEFAKANARIIKQRPRWIPEVIYVWVLGFFIKIKK